MQREQIIFVGTSDLSGHFRGKSFPAAELNVRLERGVGFSPTNMFISAFGPIHVTPFGSRGEVFLIPDPGTRVQVPFEGSTSEYFYLGDIRTQEGLPWSFCPRQVLRRALERFEQETGLGFLSTFEQEFLYDGVPAEPWYPYELHSYRRQGRFGEALLAALRQAGVIPDSFLAEFGPQQFEVTCAPAPGMRSADDAVITRELTRAVAFRLGHQVSFTPVPTPIGVSSGTHVHWSFVARDGRPTLYDESGPMNLSPQGAAFVAGLLHYLPAICAVTAPSVASYFRLRPNRWAPLRADAGVADRGAALRICPLAGDDAAQRARQFNVEFRVADATASPYLALAMLVQAGLAGIREGRKLDGGAALPLPTSLGEALTLLAASEAAAEWLGSSLHKAYVQFKRAEIASLEGHNEEEICRRYALAY